MEVDRLRAKFGKQDGGRVRAMREDIALFASWAVAIVFLLAALGAGEV